MSQSIAFLGIGIMGAPMAANLLAAGYAMRLWNRSPGKTEALEAEGAKAFESAGAAVADADVVMTMLSDGRAVDDLLVSADVAAHLKDGALVIDCSSIDPPTAQKHAAHLTEKGLGYLDAPVSGGPSGAEAAKLAIMVGGSAEDFARGASLLSELGQPTHVGPAGCGQLAKLCNQIIVGLEIGAVAEGLLLAASGGADAAAVRRAMSGGFADSLVLQIHGKRMLERSFLPGGKVTTHLKDLRNALDSAAAMGLDLPLTRAMHGLYLSLTEKGCGNYDHSAALLEIEARSAPNRLGDRADSLPE